MNSVPLRLDALFPSGAPVFGEALWMDVEPPPIHPDEAAQVATAVAKRRVEFAAGRDCARRALTRLGIEDFVLRNGPDRAPRWPEGVVGSISHAGTVPGGFCGAVVGRSRDFLTLGLDAEVADAVGPELWPRVMTARELDWLQSQPAESRPTLAAVVFSAKECFYKARFPLAGQFLDFADVEVALDWPGSSFEARLGADGAGSLGSPLLPGCKGRYLEVDGFVITGIGVPANVEIPGGFAVGGGKGGGNDPGRL
jgi:4'-phosphopantetheinyl transferase EntD